MAGPSHNGTAFYAFMKAKGQSKKASDTATGSFGIGKFAPYAVSRLRTVFVSTVYKDAEGVIQRLTQGKSILMSHRGGRAKLNTPISGRAAPMGEDRARVFRSTEDEQTTTPEPLSGIQGQGGHRGFGR
jgi:hypothetical protein